MKPKRITAYTHFTAPAVPAPGPCTCGASHEKHPAGTTYYASVVEEPALGAQGRIVLAAGPYATHQEALAMVPRVRTLVLERYNPGGRAHWYGYGTMAMAPSYNEPGKLNQELAA